MSHVYCPECGFQNPEAANYCSKCGALLHAARPQSRRRPSARRRRDELLEALDDAGVQGPALIVRSGGGRAGETFVPQGERHDDRPLARLRGLPRRRHGLAQARCSSGSDGHWTIEDQGSLNGTFVNRRRVESATLEDGDEIQIGKYRLTFLTR